MPMTKQQRRSSIVLFSLVLVFFLPMLLAYIFYHWHIELGHSTNRGELHTDLPTLAQLQIEKADGKTLLANQHWTILYLPPQNCLRPCQKQLFFMHQLGVALRADNTRTQKYVLVAAHAENQQSSAQLAELAKRYTLPMATLHNNKFTLNENYLYLADPHGNLILAYQPPLSVDDLRVDLNHLLKNSQIG